MRSYIELTACILHSDSMIHSYLTDLLPVAYHRPRCPQQHETNSNGNAESGLPAVAKTLVGPVIQVDILDHSKLQ